MRARRSNSSLSSWLRIEMGGNTKVDVESVACPSAWLSAEKSARKVKAMISMMKRRSWVFGSLRGVDICQVVPVDDVNPSLKDEGALTDVGTRLAEDGGACTEY